MSCPVLAAIEYDQSVTPAVIFGSGNANGSFTTDRQNNIELGLRGKLRFDQNDQPQNIFNSNGDGSYTFSAGTPSPSGGFGFDPSSPATTPIWNFEWSINSDQSGLSNTPLSAYRYVIALDFDPSNSVDSLNFDPINQPYADHAVGDNNTANGDGIVAGDPGAYAVNISNNNVAQNSWNYEFFNSMLPFSQFDPNEPGEYTISLSAFELNSPNDNSPLAQSTIRILVEAVPEPGAVMVWLGLTLCAGLVTARRSA